ncbi:DUF6644 family protein [Parapedobacter indicus]|uniref:DUF6644 domain-containing protein n=1 Tax=Parapedobacter indicus TaxID=1477437 RepID=A0A1I3IL67_9SPHI|nr:DUF6644 family protein [Parapedobacter indicus]PPL02213.1 hypothetical protein CLV26_104138 [Parapedobacter indicus]SFI48686.1 hypothetical protein SAMN05444682_104138 [Parapedobacter indicus]
MTDFLDWLENTPWADEIRQSLWLYPALEIVHIVGIVVLVGAAFMFDLRLLGVSKSMSLSGLSSYLLPWSARGLLLIIPSGILLFITNAQALGNDPTFLLKLGLLGIAALNVLVFHRFMGKRHVTRAGHAAVPAAAKVSAMVSIGVWIAVIACGRLLAY